MSYLAKLKDPRWQKKRLEIFERDFFLCQHCMGGDETLHVHHLKYSGDPWECEDKFLITLCETCHKREEEQKSFDWYSKLVDYSVTRAKLDILLDHVAFKLESGNFNDVLRSLVPESELSDYVKWRHG